MRSILLLRNQCSVLPDTRDYTINLFLDLTVRRHSVGYSRFEAGKISNPGIVGSFKVR